MSNEQSTMYYSVLPLLEALPSRHAQAALVRESGFVFELDPETRRAFGSPEPLRRILSLLANLSLETVRTGERVHIAARTLPTGVHISLSLPPSPAVHLTFQALPGSGAEKKTPPATLAGLADNLIFFSLAQKIAAMNGMKVWLDQDPLMARFNVYIHDYGMMARVQREKPLVLVIEDVVPIGTLLEYYLNHAGFQTIHAYNGEVGVEETLKHMPDLITLDVWMPSMDGLEVLNVLKTNPATKAIPIVLITVLPNRLVGYERGASDYLQKPVMREDVVECAMRLTRRGSPVRPAYPESAVTIAAITPAARASTAVSAGFPAASVQVFDLHDRGLISTLAEQSPPPSMFVFDIAGVAPDAEALAARLRLLEQFNAAPLVALLSEGGDDLRLMKNPGIFDAAVPAASLNAESIRGILHG